MLPRKRDGMSEELSRRKFQEPLNPDPEMNLRHF
jgi:hypothetical protein